MHFACLHIQRRATNLKAKTSWNSQKIELCGSLTTKELKKKHSSRLVDYFRQGHLFLGERRGSHQADYHLTSVTRKFQTDSFKIPFLGETETAVKLGINSWWG